MTPEPTPRPERLEFTPAFACAITLLAAFLSFLLFVMLAREDRTPPAAHGFAMLAGYAAMFALAAPRLPQPPRLALGLLAPPPRAWLALVLLLPATLLVSELDNWLRAFLPRPEGDGAGAVLPFELAQLALVHVVVMPAAEEIFFRGMIQPRLVERFGVPGGVIFTAALSIVPVLPFGLIWLGTAALAEALILGVVRQLSGSTIASIVLHACFGAITVAATARVFGIPGFDELEAAHTPWIYLAPAALSCAVGFLLLRGLRAEP